MNTYNENLQTTVNNTLATLSAEQARLESAQIADDYTLYYAQGMAITARQQLDDTQQTAALHQAINDYSQRIDNAAYNLQLSAQLSNTVAGTSTVNMATAASNVNIAATAISVLAADLGAALNNTIASLFDTEVYRQVREANSFINEVANEAKEVSRVAMDVSSKASEVVAQATLEQTTGIKTRIDDLLKTAQAESDRFSSQISASTAAANQALNLERQAEGAVRDIDSQVRANAQAYENANSQLNLNLEISVNAAHEISVSFNSQSSVLPDFTTLSAHGITIPHASPLFHLLVIPLDQAPAFTIDQAEQLFLRQIGNHIPVKPERTQKITLTKDALGEDVRPGTHYVAYLHIEPSMEYRRFVGSFSNLLSAPSQPFLLATPLPLAHPYNGDKSEPGPETGVLQSLYFSTTSKIENLPGLEYRCILVEEGKLRDLYLMQSPEFSDAPIYFNLAIAQQVAPSNYETAESFTVTKPSRKKAADAEPQADDKESANDSVTLADADQTHYYRVPLFTTTTDNFGNPLTPGIKYQPYILSVVDSDKNNNAEAYVSVLSDKLRAITLPAV